MKITAWTGIRSAVLQLNEIIQCLQEEDYQVEIDDVCAHITINCCDCAVLKSDIHTSRRMWSIAKILECSSMRKDALKLEA